MASDAGCTSHMTLHALECISHMTLRTIMNTRLHLTNLQELPATPKHPFFLTIVLRTEMKRLHLQPQLKTPSITTNQRLDPVLYL